MINKKLLTVCLFVIITGGTTIGLIFYHSESNEVKPAVVSNPENKTYIDFNFILLDKHMPSSYQISIKPNYGHYGNSYFLLLEDPSEMIGEMKFLDNSTGKMNPLSNCGGFVCVTNSSVLWMVDRLSDNYRINMTETLDPNVNTLFEKGFTQTDSDGYQTHWIKLNVKKLIQEFGGTQKYMTPISTLYLFYNNPSIEPKINECTSLYNVVLNKLPDWEYAHAKFSVDCTQSQVFKGDWR